MGLDQYNHYYDYEYDEEGRIIYAEIFDEEEDLIRTDEISYNENGNQSEIKMVHYTDGWSLIDRYDYDEKNRVIKEERLQGGTPIESKEYTYDENDLVLEEETRNRNGWTIHRFLYEFFAEATT